VVSRRLQRRHRFEKRARAAVATALKQVDPATRGPSLLDNAEFQAARQRLPKEANSVGYTDTKYFTRLCYPLMTPLATLGLSMLGKTDAALDLLSYPPLPEQLAGANPGVGTTSTDADGILMLHVGGGIPVVPTAAAMTTVLLPSLARAREITKRAVSAANLRGVGQGCHIYANDHQGRFPKSLDELVTDGTVTAKQLHSPRDPGPEDVASYVYIAGQTTQSDPRNVLAYERVQGNEGSNALFIDGHVQWMKLDAFRAAVRETYQRLDREDELPKEFAE
jgi:prepilin-type processing-associated H-X9-DG protein